MVGAITPPINSELLHADRSVGEKYEENYEQLSARFRDPDGG